LDWFSSQLDVFSGSLTSGEPSAPFGPSQRYPSQPPFPASFGHELLHPIGGRWARTRSDSRSPSLDTSPPGRILRDPRRVPDPPVDLGGFHRSAPKRRVASASSRQALSYGSRHVSLSLSFLAALSLSLRAPLQDTFPTAAATELQVLMMATFPSTTSNFGPSFFLGQPLVLFPPHMGGYGQMRGPILTFIDFLFSLSTNFSSTNRRLGDDTSNGACPPFTLAALFLSNSRGLLRTPLFEEFFPLFLPIRSQNEGTLFSE